MTPPDMNENEDKRTTTMLDDIFANNEQRLRDLRTKYSADTVASMVNDRLEVKKIEDRVTGSEVDGFLKVSKLSKNIALVDRKTFKDSMNFDGEPVF